MSQASSTSSQESIPHLPPDSPGSSVSLRLQEEYDELLKYAVVVPKCDPSKMPQTLTTIRGALENASEEGIITIKARPQKGRGVEEGPEEEEEGEEKTPRQKEEYKDHRVRYLPDFDQSSITSKDHSSTSSFVERGTGKASDDSSRDFVHPLFPEPRTFESQEKKQGVDDIYSVHLDPDVGRLETVVDQWCLEFKRNVLAEFSQSKLLIVQQTQKELLREKQRHATEKSEMMREMNSMKELLHTYEQSMERKDQIVSNLTAAVQRHRDKLELMRKFSDWRLKQNDAKREAFASVLARKHFEKKLCQRVISAWFSTIYNKWKQRVEKACQTKAQEVCMQLTNDYEAKITSLNEALDVTKQEVKQLHVERERYEEAMKKAFMRGVCALNMEAMNIFHEEDARDPTPRHPERNGNEASSNINSIGHEKGTSSSKVLFQEPVGSSQPSEHSTAKVLSAQGSRSGTMPTQTRQSSAKPVTASVPSTSKGRAVTTRMTGKSGESSRHWGRSLSPTLDPPMASVVVERHQPVTKQTIGHATASKYPRVASDNTAFKRLAGQADPLKIIPHVQTVHVVE
ncbi:centrosomal protein POC5-like isoform X1 [Pomacea canaliculata]|uniref:centrosomal protein POC5-like isoform X1 n=1 Tax=Pomacea canaliculata TaxID=400727 RepID=UPI000D72C6FB|nr:centrosomal protein POC5-like isoform X1 [Pomacea canaliculata]